MTFDILNDFVKTADVDPALIEKYEDKLPEEIIHIWKNYGFGTFHNGYFKVIDPEDYQELLEKTYFRGDVSIPVIATAFADLLVWKKGEFLEIVKYRYNDFDTICAGCEYFDEVVTDEELAAEYFSYELHEEAVAKHGQLEFDECFAFVPLLALGGSESAERTKKVKMYEHIALMTSMTGGV